MAKLLKLRRGTTSQHSSFTGAEGEVTIDTDKETVVVHDGSTAGGHPVAAEDMANVSSASIAGRLGTDSIATTKIAAGALPTDVTVASANIVDGSIVNADVNASAAIAGTKIAPNFGSQDITTTGKVLFANVYSTEGDLPSASTYHGMFAHVHGTGLAYYAHGGNWIKLAPLNAPDFTGGIDVTGNITATGTIDGRDLAADGTKLDGIESSATADQSNAEIRAAVEAASDSNVFTDADHTKLNGIETSATADQTASEIVSLIADQNITPDTVYVGSGGKVGRDNNDYLTFDDNAYLDVYINGNNEFRFEADGDFHADGDVIAQSTTISSDRRLKENIQVVPNALDKVEALNGVSFDWKKTGEKSAGVIAQEVQEVLPEAVKEVTPIGGGDSHLSVNYHALTSILIEAIKELKAEVEQLKGGE